MPPALSANQEINELAEERFEKDNALSLNLESGKKPDLSVLREGCFSVKKLTKQQIRLINPLITELESRISQSLGQPASALVDQRVKTRSPKLKWMTSEEIAESRKKTQEEIDLADQVMEAFERRQSGERIEKRNAFVFFLFVAAAAAYVWYKNPNMIQDFLKEFKSA